MAPGSNADPVLGRCPATPSSGVAPLPVAFSAAATDADGDALTYTWDLNGDGTFETTGATPSFTYTTAGVYNAVVKVTDARGASATKSVTVSVSPPAGTGTDVPLPVGGTVPSVLSLTLGTAPTLGTFLPGVDRDYTASVAATVTATSTASALTVRDPSSTATGRLVNGTMALATPLQLKVGDAAFGPLSGSALTLTTFATPVGARPVQVDMKQSIAATEPLLSGGYGKTLVFTLTATTP